MGIVCSVCVCVHAVKSNQEHHYGNSGQVELEMKFHYKHLFVILSLSLRVCWANSNHRPKSKCTHRLTHFVAKFFQVVFPLVWLLHLDLSLSLSLARFHLAIEHKCSMETQSKSRPNWYHLHYYSAQVSSDEEPKTGPKQEREREKETKSEKKATAAAAACK